MQQPNVQLFKSNALQMQQQNAQQFELNALQMQQKNAQHFESIFGRINAATNQKNAARDAANILTLVIIV
jgi:hypothetical protein